MSKLKDITIEAIEAMEMEAIESGIELFRNDSMAKQLLAENVHIYAYDFQPTIEELTEALRELVAYDYNDEIFENGIEAFNSIMGKYGLPSWSDNDMFDYYEDILEEVITAIAEKLN